MGYKRRCWKGLVTYLSLLLSVKCNSFLYCPIVVTNGGSCTTRFQTIRSDDTKIVPADTVPPSPTTPNSTLVQHFLSSSARFAAILALLLTSPQPSTAASSSSPVTLNVIDDTTQGIPLITQSGLGKSVRSTVISGAKVADNLDLKWERVSDSLRDQKKCDPRTNRRLFDNGKRKDGTSIGNPVLGALCELEEMSGVDGGLVGVVLESAEDSAAEVLGVRKEQLRQQEANLENLVGGSFQLPSSSSSSSNTATATEDDDVMRRTYNKDLYVRMRSFSDILSQQPTNTNERNRLSRQLERTWGSKLLTQLAPNANRDDFVSPFPKPDPIDDRTYDEGALLDALGSVSVVLNKLRAGGLIGHWEISIPEDDFWNVVTIAVDDDSSINGQILGRERGQNLGGSPVTAVVRSVMEEKGIGYAMDVFFIDPTTTKQELYDPTQLLISLSNLGQ